MGWLLLLLLGVTAMAGIVRGGAARPLWPLVGAALLLGATGYALQGRPTLPAAPARPPAAAVDDDGGEAGLRDAMLGRFGPDAALLVAGDALVRSGDPGTAARLLIGGLNARPGSAALWCALGGALARHDGGQVSPPALLAFGQAARLAPGNPAPPFFLGLAYARAGDLAAARGPWARALALSPPGAPWRPLLGQRLRLLDRYLAQRGPAPA